MKWQCVLLSLTLFALAPRAVHAQDCLSDECPVWCDLPGNVLRYQVGALPEGLDEAAAISEIQRAAARFDALPCAAPSFEYAGRVADGGSAPVVFEAVDGITPPSVAGIRWRECLLEATIELADVEGWSVDAPASPERFDVYTVAMSGFGHAFGLQSRLDDTAFGRYRGARTDLSPSDVEAVCALYQQDIAFCGPCVNDSQCAGDDNRCVAYPAGGRCGRVCTESGGECAEDEVCDVTADGSRQCVRIIEGVRGCEPAAQGCRPCSTGADCDDGSCVGYSADAAFCGAPCSPERPCDDGFSCVASGARDVCVRFAGEPVRPSCELGTVAVPADIGPDAGTPDASALDASLPTDAGMSEPTGGCAVSPRRPAGIGLLFLLGVLALCGGRRRVASAARTGLPLLLLLLTAPSPAAAYECLAETCPSWCETTVAVQVGALPPSLDEDAAISEIRRALDLLNAVECSLLTLDYAGRVPASGPTAPVVIDTLATSEGGSHRQESEWIDHCVVSGTITLTADAPWSVVDPPPEDADDLFSIVLSSLGSIIGLRGSEPGSAFALPGVPTGELADSDIAGICALYGNERAFCEPCFADAQCLGEDNRCIAYPGGETRCGQACSDDAECASGDVCAASDGGAGQCRRRLDGVETCEALAEGCTPCDDDAVCGGGGCMPYGRGAYCAPPCVEGACEDGFTCVAFSPDAAGPMFCVRYVAPTEASCRGGTDPVPGEVPPPPPPAQDAGRRLDAGGGVLDGGPASAPDGGPVASAGGCAVGTGRGTGGGLLLLLLGLVVGGGRRRSARGGRGSRPTRG